MLPAAHTRLEELLAPRVERLSLLIAEDDAIMAKLLRDMLMRLGFSDIRLASDGREALEQIQQKPVDILFCDWQMEPMDGFSLTRHIRMHPDSPNRFIPIIMMTGRAEAQDVIQARDAGVTEYLLKPVTLKTLCARIVEVVERPRDFVISRHYTGPDRRRKRLTPPPGKDRRARVPVSAIAQPLIGA